MDEREAKRWLVLQQSVGRGKVWETLFSEGFFVSFFGLKK
jgi:hypothetical protein